MFPLGNTVFPHQVVPLHVFEPRYLRLVEDVAAFATPTFGIALIDRGHEVGGGDHRVHVATRVDVVRSERFDDGRYAVIAFGVERLDVVEWLDDDPYPRATVRRRDRRDTGGGPLDDVESLLRATLSLTLAGETLPDLSFSDDPLARLDQLSALAPVSTFDRQRILEAETSSVQIDRLHASLVERKEMLEAMADS